MEDKRKGDKERDKKKFMATIKTCKCSEETMRKIEEISKEKRWKKNVVVEEAVNWLYGQTIENPKQRKEVDR